MNTLKLTEIWLAGIIFLLFSCHNARNDKVNNLAPGTHQVTAEEVIQATNYTYVRVKEKNKDYWLAITKSDIKTNSTYFWSRGMPMENFHSKDLERTFPQLYLVQDFTDKPITLNGHPSSSSSWAGTKPAIEQENVSVPPAENGITLGELFAHKDQYSGKNVIVKGKVVKYNPMIMGKNWIHIQDGSKSGNDFDLAITSLNQAKLGEIVTFEGKISLDKNFGAGYFYKVIMENARKIEDR